MARLGENDPERKEGAEAGSPRRQGARPGEEQLTQARMVQRAFKILLKASLERGGLAWARSHLP